MITSKDEIINLEIELEYKIAVLTNKVDMSLKNRSKNNFFEYSKQLNEAYQEKDKALKYISTFHKKR